MTKSYLSQLTLSLAVSAALGCLWLAGCSSQPEAKKEAPAEPSAATAPPAEIPKPPEAAKKEEPARKEETAKKAEAAKKEEPAPKEAEPPKDLYKVRFATTKGDVIVQVHRDWAPKGAERFRELVKDHYFDGARFFR